VVLVLGAAAVVGCVRPHETEDEKLRRETAESTRELRRDAQNAGVEARKAAEQARRQAQDIVAGVREGLHGDAPRSGMHGKVNLNTASVAELSGLDGLSESTAKKIVHHRPYGSADELVHRGILSPAQYDRILDDVTVH
jgi:DNA uptake protein ComE-like DNA-binding protein